MKYSLILLTLLYSSWACAEVDFTPFLGRDVDQENIYRPEKSNWVATFGFEAQGLPVKRSFKGQAKSYGEKDELLTGVRLGLGRDFYLGAGFSTRTQLEGYFVGTMFEPKKSVTSADKKAESSYSQKQGNIWGGEVSQLFSYSTEVHVPSFIGEHKIKMYFEPFLQAGIGMGKSFFRFDYTMNENAIDEDYRRVEDNTFISQKISIGFNLISQSGYFFTVQASQVAHQVSDSKSYERIGRNSVIDKKDIDQKDDTINLAYSYYLGGGYKW